MTWDQGPYGKLVRSAAAATDAWAVPIPNLPTPTIDNITVHTVKAMTSAGTWAMGAGVPWSPQGAWASPYWTIGMAYNAGADTFYFHTNHAGTLMTIAGAVTPYWLSDGRFHSYTGSWGSQGAWVYRDGVMTESAPTVFPPTVPWTPSAIVGTPETVFLGRSVSAVGEGFVGRHALTIIWLRRLDPVEVAMVHADPFCFLVR
jgi:hypothetical protein